MGATCPLLQRILGQKPKSPASYFAPCLRNQSRKGGERKQKESADHLSESWLCDDVSLVDKAVEQLSGGLDHRQVRVVEVLLIFYKQQEKISSSAQKKTLHKLLLLIPFWHYLMTHSHSHTHALSRRTQKKTKTKEKTKGENKRRRKKGSKTWFDVEDELESIVVVWDCGREPCQIETVTDEVFGHLQEKKEKKKKRKNEMKW